MCLDHYFVCFFRYIMLFFPCSNPVYYQSCIFCIFVVFWVFSFRKLPFSGYSVDCYDLYSGCSCFYFLFPYALTNLKCLFHLFPPNQSVKTKFFLRNIRRMHYVCIRYESFSELRIFMFRFLKLFLSSRALSGK